MEKDALDLCAERGDDADAIPFPKLMKKAVLKAHRSRHLPQTGGRVQSRLLGQPGVGGNLPYVGTGTGTES